MLTCAFSVRIFLFCGFYNFETWDDLVSSLGEVPRWKNFDLAKYEAILHIRSAIRRQKLYTPSFQIVPPVIYFGRKLPHYAATLRFIMSLMEMGMPERLRSCSYAIDASYILQTAPTLGPFMSLNMLCYFNDTPHVKFSYRDFASCGPGSRFFLRKMFGKRTINSVAMEEAGLRWLYEHQWRYWARIGSDPPHAWDLGVRPGMRVLDFENALCWCHRYVNGYQQKGYASLADVSHPRYDPSVTDVASMPAWCEEQRQIGDVNKTRFKDDYEEERGKLECLGEEVYEVEKVVCRKGSRDDRDGLFRVRWKGYPPEDDSWERASSLRNGAEEVSESGLGPIYPANPPIHCAEWQC